MKLKQDISSSKSLLNYLKYFIPWLCLAIAIGIIIGSVVALFLSGLNIVTHTRASYPHLLFGLPFAGLAIGLIYHYFGDSANKGNNLLLEEYQSPSKVLPFKLAPFVLIGTWTTHLFGGSAGREGTAIQIGATLSDQINSLFPQLFNDRRRVLLMGIAAGFAAVFGTPIAAFIFSIEIVNKKIKTNFLTLISILITAYTAHFTCLLWGIEHTLYQNPFLPNWSFLLILKLGICALLFGLTARLFILLTDNFNALLNRYIHYPPLIPFTGALLFLALYYLIGDERFLGLGIPTILESFETPQSTNVFLLKILFTSITLGAGFKGGEVTPLFFIGATLGSMLSVYFNLPITFLAAIGFIAVFSGATKTPIACAFMGVELFGFQPFLYFLFACTLSYLISGNNSIYKSQNHIPLWKAYFHKKRSSKNS